MFRLIYSFCCFLLALSLFGAAYAAEQDAADTGKAVETLQEKMKSDPKIMEMILSLKDDPEFQKALQDPAIISAISSGDIEALEKNPQFMKLLNNATVKQIEKKIQEQKGP